VKRVGVTLTASEWHRGCFGVGDRKRSDPADAQHHRGYAMNGRTSIKAICVFLLPTFAGACGFVFTHGPPAGHERMNYISCTEGNLGPILDVAWASLAAVTILKTAANPDDVSPAIFAPTPGRDLVIGIMAVEAGIYTLAAVTGFGKTKRCKAARQQLATREAQLLREVGTPQPAGINVIQAVMVGPSEATLEIGEQVQLVATAMNSGGSAISNKLFSWSSSNPAIASVSVAGLVTAHANGTVVIAATSENVTGTARIVVSSPN
jgi:hypothetical protein